MGQTGIVGQGRASHHTAGADGSRRGRRQTSTPTPRAASGGPRTVAGSDTGVKLICTVPAAGVGLIVHSPNEKNPMFSKDRFPGVKLADPTPDITVYVRVKPTPTSARN